MLERLCLLTEGLCLFIGGLCLNAEGVRLLQEGLCVHAKRFAPPCQGVVLRHRGGASLWGATRHNSSIGRHKPSRQTYKPPGRSQSPQCRGTSTAPRHKSACMIAPKQLTARNYQPCSIYSMWSQCSVGGGSFSGACHQWPLLTQKM